MGVTLCRSGEGGKAHSGITGEQEKVKDKLCGPCWSQQDNNYDCVQVLCGEDAREYLMWAQSGVLVDGNADN